MRRHCALCIPKELRGKYFIPKIEPALKHELEPSNFVCGNRE